MSGAKMRIYCVIDSSRSHKVRVLLDGMDVVHCSRLRDCFFRGSRVKGEIVLVDSFGIIGVKALLVSLFLGIPLVVRLRGNFIREAYEVYMRSPSLKSLVKQKIQLTLAEVCLYRTKLLVVNSQYLDSVVHKYYPTIRTAIVYNPYTQGLIADRAETDFPASGTRILSITNFNLLSKVQPLLVGIRDWIPMEMWEKYDVHWIICGAGPLSRDFHESLRSLPFSDRVQYIGHVENVASLLDWATMFVHLSELDAFPNVTLEAMMHEKPIITNDRSCGTLEQVFNNVNGFVVSSANEFAESVACLAENPQLARDFGMAGKAIVEREFSVQRQASNMQKVLCDLVGVSCE